MPSNLRKLSSNTVRIRYRRINYLEILTALRNYAADLIRSGMAELVLLFGSLARGDYTGSSDADFLIIAKNAAKCQLDRYSAYLDPTLPIEISLIILLQNECCVRLGTGDPFLVTVISEAALLAGDKDL
ncbi:MAG: nucleotidyltransferase domain-containing protein [Candidatus Hodarchaeota archaeon]